MDLDPELITKLLAVKMPAAAAREVLRVLAEHQQPAAPVKASTLRSQRFRARQRNGEGVACNALATFRETPMQQDSNAAETLQTPPPPLPPQTPPTPPPPPRPSLARSRTMHDWAHDIVKAYPLQDNFTENVLFMTQWLNRYSDREPHTILALVNRCVAIIRAKAPQGMSSQFVPAGQSFFTEEKFLAPEAFENRWTERRPSNQVTTKNPAYTAAAATAGLDASRLLGPQPPKATP